MRERPFSWTTRDTSNLEIENERSSSVFPGRMHATTRVASRRGAASAGEAPRRRNVRIYRTRTIVFATIASDIRKRPVRFHEWNGFAYNDREIGYRADFGAHYGPMCAERRAEGYLVAEMTKLPTDEHRRKSTAPPPPSAPYRILHRSVDPRWIEVEEKFRRLRPRCNLSDVSDDAR